MLTIENQRLYACALVKRNYAKEELDPDWHYFIQHYASNGSNACKQLVMLATSIAIAACTQKPVMLLDGFLACSLTGSMMPMSSVLDLDKTNKGLDMLFHKIQKGVDMANKPSSLPTISSESKAQGMAQAGSIQAQASQGQESTIPAIPMLMDRSHATSHLTWRVIAAEYGHAAVAVKQVMDVVEPWCSPTRLHLPSGPRLNQFLGDPCPGTVKTLSIVLHIVGRSPWRSSSKPK